MAAGLPGGGPAAGPGGRTLDGVDDAEELHRQKNHSDYNKEKCPAVHEKDLRSN
jgi:hypothetical protein